MTTASDIWCPPWRTAFVLVRRSRPLCRLCPASAGARTVRCVIWCGNTKPVRAWCAGWRARTANGALTPGLWCGTEAANPDFEPSSPTPSSWRTPMKRAILSLAAVCCRHRLPGASPMPSWPSTSARRHRLPLPRHFADALKPAVQGGVDYAAGGFYVGAWASTIKWIKDVRRRQQRRDRPVRRLQGRDRQGRAFDVGVLTYQYPSNKPGHQRQHHRGVRRRDLRPGHAEVLARGD
jgi:hypothetical protein